MILKTCFLLVLSVAWEVSGASFSKVYVQTGPEVAPAVDYSQYGSQIYSYASPQLEHLNAAPVGYEYPVSSSYNNYGVRCLPSNCYYPGQTIASVASIVPSANVVAYKPPVSTVPVAYSAAANPSGYEYSYVIVDQHSGEHQSHSELSDSGLVRGEYSFLQPDGIVREVQYVADDEQGFNAIVKNFLPASAAHHEHHESHVEHPTEHEHPAHEDHEARHGHHDEPAEHEHHAHHDEDEARHGHHDEPAEHEHHEDHDEHEARHGHHDEPAEHEHHEEHEARHGHPDNSAEHEHHEDHAARHGHHNEPAEHEGHDEHHGDHEARHGGHKDPDSKEEHHHEEHSGHPESHHHTHEPENHETHHKLESGESDESKSDESDEHPAHNHITHEDLREGSLAEGHHPTDGHHESHHEHHELQTVPEHGNVYVSYKDFIKCMQAAMNKVNALPAVPRPASPLTYLVFNKPC